MRMAHIKHFSASSRADWTRGGSVTSWPLSPHAPPVTLFQSRWPLAPHDNARALSPLLHEYAIMNLAQAVRGAEV
jgi:hypothetical protein